MEMFMALLGQETGNLAFKVLATGGVFISGELVFGGKVTASDFS
jgi:glucokinase